MSEKELNLDSDESDDDYIPEGVNPIVSEEEGSGDEESDYEETKAPETKRRRTDPVEVAKSPPAKESNLDIDSLWADFKKDSEKPKPKTESSSVTAPSSSSLPQSSRPQSMIPLLKKSTAPKGGSGISSILSQIGKKGGLSTLEKSKLDWNNFKKSEGIEEEVSTHNKGKDGFLEKRDFLERTDMRQFEIEKKLRSVKRSNR